MTDQTTEPVTQQQETVTKQKNPLRTEQGKKLVEYNKCKKEDVYAGGLSVFGLAICGYLLYNKFKKQERNLIVVPPPPVVKNNTELKRDIFEML